MDTTASFRMIPSLDVLAIVTSYTRHDRTTGQSSSSLLLVMPKTVEDVGSYGSGTTIGAIVWTNNHRIPQNRIP